MKLCWNHRPILEAIRIDDIPRDFRGFQPLISLRPHETIRFWALRIFRHTPNSNQFVGDISRL